jgi:hypothetical protein
LKLAWPHIAFILALIVAGLALVTYLVQPTIDKKREEVLQYAEKENRVPPWDAVVNTPFLIEHIQQHPPEQPMIGLFGPSTVFGTTVGKGSHTTAGVLQEQEPNYEVVNLGLTGARFTETYAILASVIDQVDYVIYEVNYGMVVVSDNEPDIVVYPQMLGKLNCGCLNGWLADFPEKNGGSLPSQTHQWLQRNALNYWSLYKYRDVLSYDLGKTRTPKEKLRRLLETEFAAQSSEGSESAVPAPSLSTPYVKMTAGQQQLINEHFRDLYEWHQPFDEEHSFGLLAIEKTLDLLKEHGKPALIYTAPLDRKMIDQGGLLDWEEYDRIMDSYRKLVEGYGYPFVDYNSADAGLDHEYYHNQYHDPSHLLNEGSYQFGQVLAQTVQQQLLSQGEEAE